jgi:hypothetical protein
MVTFQLKQGEEVLNVPVPQCYADLSYGQLLRFRMEGHITDLGHITEIMTGVPRSVWMKAPIDVAKTIQGYLQWIISDTTKFDELVTPKHLTYRGVSYPIPLDLGLETFGQKIIMEGKVSEVVAAMATPGQPIGTPNDLKNLNAAAKEKYAKAFAAIIPYMVACYMQPRVTGKEFDENEILAVEQEILNCRAVEVYPIGNFFIKTILGLPMFGTPRLVDRLKKASLANSKKGRVSKKSKKKRVTS